MPFAVSKRASKHNPFKDINIVPVLNVFLILIPFLLLTVVMSRMVVLNLRLPEKKEQGLKIQAEKQINQRLILVVSSDSIIFKQDSVVIGTYPFSIVEDFDAFKLVCDSLKTRFSDVDNLLFKPADNIQYQTIISLMDITRASGFKRISLSY